MLIRKILIKSLQILPDKLYIKFKYFCKMGKKLNLKNPKTFNEKLQWLKLYDRRPIYTLMADKSAVREIVKEKIGEEYLPELLGIYKSFDEIDFSLFPQKFVLKCTHDSGGLVVCKDKSEFSPENARNKIEKSLKTNYFWHSREWPYKNIEPKIIAEKFMEEKRIKSDSLVPYKVFCFDGVPKIIQVIKNDKTDNELIDYYDTEWNLLSLKQNYPNSPEKIKKSDKLEEMLELSAKLSKGIPFLRVDWYIPEDKLVFSEFTFFSDGGFAKFEPEVWDKTLGDYIKL